jgi:pyrroline-5-carboxylate reductase
MRLLFIGCGNMGGAILNSLQEKQDQYDISIIDPHANISDFKNHNINLYQDISNLADDAKFDLLIFAVKPQIIKSLLPSYKKLVTDSNLVLTMLAGTKLDLFTKELSQNAKIARIMPNICAKISASTTLLSCNKNCATSDKRILTDFLQNFGSVHEINEDSIDSATAISGSGPAYMLKILNDYIEASSKLDIDPDLAKKLIINCFSATIKLADQTQDLQQLIKAVTSPGGTTEAGLKILEEDNISKTISNSLKAAKNRAKELS